MTQTPAAPRSAFTRRWKWNRRKPLRGFLNGVLRFLFGALTRVQISGLQRVPRAGGAIAMINHIHALDPLLIMPHVGRDVTPMPKVEMFESAWMRPIALAYGSIPVHRGTVDREAIRAAVEVLESGGMLVMSPEGTRSHNRALQKAQDGMMFIATRAKCDVTIVPIGLLDTDGILPALKRLRRPTVHIVVGEPYTIAPVEGRRDLTTLTTDAMQRLAALLPPDMRGVYGAATPGVS